MESHSYPIIIIAFSIFNILFFQIVHLLFKSFEKIWRFSFCWYEIFSFSFFLKKLMERKKETKREIDKERERKRERKQREIENMCICALMHFLFWFRFTLDNFF